jgi:uncharacterized repeat protein (TIGR01451 family)
MPNAQIGLAKRTVATVLNADGSFTVTFEFVAENFGNVDLQNVQIQDGLVPFAFPAPCSIVMDNIEVTAGDFSINPDYNGTSINTLLAQGQVLPAGDISSVLLTVTVDNCNAGQTMFLNSALATAEGPNGDPTEDMSTDGSDPDPNNDGDPSEMEQTPIMITPQSAIGAAKRLVNVQVMPNNSFDITFEFNIENFGNVDLCDLTLTDDLTAAFPSSCVPTVVSLSSSDFLVDAAYAGTDDVMSMLLAGQCLAPGETGEVLLTVNVADCGADQTTFFNVGVASGTPPGTNDPLTDTTTNGSDPDPNGDGVPDEDDVTPISIDVVFDLALRKQAALNSPTVLNPGDQIAFVIEVFNQGDISADNIEIVDYVPDGLLFDATLNPEWAFDAVTGTASITLSAGDGELPVDGLEPGQSTTITITLVVADAMFPDCAGGTVSPDDSNPDGVESGQVITNTAEIASATDALGNAVVDNDSTMDDVSDNDGTVNDDEINGNGAGNEDEDDNDIAIVTVECYQDPGVNNTIQVCLGCDEAAVTINLFESLAGLPNIGGVFTEGALFFMDEDGNPVAVDLSDPENVVIPGTLDRTRSYSIDYTIAAVNDCPEMTATITIEMIDIQNLSCTGFQNISLGEDCEAEITPDLILQGNLFCASSLEVVILNLSGDTLRDAAGNVTATVGNDQVNQTLFVSLVDPQCDNTCWGQITIEDKKRPEIECPDDVSGFNGVDFICTDFDEIFQENTVTYTGEDVPDLLIPTGVPVIDDNCTPLAELVVDFYDLEIPNADPQCNIRTILRTFTVTDQSGNTATCVQQITVRPPTLADVNLPDVSDPIEISCGTAYDALPNGNPVPSAGGEPTITTAFGTFPIPGNAAYCNIAAGFEDSERIVTCPNTFKFVRTYTIFDWCDTNGEALTYSQVVKVGDFDAPVFTAPTNLDDDGLPVTGPLVYGTNAGDECAAFIRLDDSRITLTDDCSASIQLTAAIYLNGDLDSAPLGSFVLDLNNATPELSTAIPAGDHIIRYMYVDDCGNAGETDVDIRVEDQTAPVAICEDGLNISITGSDGNGFAVLTPEMLDAGSYDDCCEITMAIARVGGNDLPLAGEVYRDEITLECDDAGVVRVGLRVTDCNGNENFCWLDVLVEDKLAPSCVAPANTTITCVDYNASLPNDITEATDAQLDALFGQAAGADNCNTTITQTVSGTINSCGVGSITRRFSSTDGAGFTNTNLCVQNITVIGIHDYRITFPTDEEGDCMEIPAFDGVVAEELACDLITTTVDVDTLRTQEAGEECFKLRVTYDVVNWCEYNSLGEPYVIRREAPGARDRTRNPRDIDEDLLFVNVTPGPTTATTEDDVAFYSLISSDRTFNPAPSPQQDVALGDNGEGDADDDNTYGTDVYGSRGFFRYTQFIKIYDEVAPEITFEEPAECFAGSGEGCLATVSLEFTVTDECSTPTSDVELDANFVAANGFQPDNAAALGIIINIVVDEATGTRTLTASNVPAGEHAIRISANDGCGNTDVQIIEFCVTADRTPTPICIQTLTVTLMNDGNGGGIAAIWASDFIASPIVDCNGNVVEDYSLYRSSDAGDAGFTPAAGTIGIDDITCDDLGDLSVRVYAFDAAGSTPDYCEVVVEVQDNAGHCEGGSTGNIAGVILTEEMETIENVVVSLEGSDGVERSMTTTDDGAISFSSLPFDEDYTVSPSHYTDFLEGVRTSDIVRATRHILGVSELETPYLRIAADVNGDESIDVGDIITIRSLILGLIDVYPNDVPSWTFVPVGYDFPSPANPWAEDFPQVSNYNDFAATITDADFIGVKMGDLNRSAVPNSRMPRSPRNFRGDLELELDEVEMIQGETYTVPVTAAELTSVDGYQFTLEFDRTAVTISGIEPGLVTNANFGWRFADRGLVTTSWSWSGTEVPADWTGDEVLFSLVVQAEANGKLSDAIDAGNRFTEAEAYDRNGAGLRNLTFVFNEEIVEVAGYQLLQNVPNPVRKEAVIGYQLPEAHAEVVIVITDAAGRLVREVRQEGIIGYNQVTLTKRQLGNTSGVFSYTVSAGDWVATKRMVVVD